jgi:hypothetical protein
LQRRPVRFRLAHVVIVRALEIPNLWQKRNVTCILDYY